MQVDSNYTIDLLRRLVQINSINPSLDPSGAGEREIAQFIAQEMEGFGLEVTTYEPVPGRPSVVAALGNGDGPVLAFNAHIDTVDICGMSNPYGAEVRDGKLYGRGSYDMKGGLAACMSALRTLRESGASFRGSVELHAVADEEHSSLGTIELLKHRRIDAAIVTEPTALQVCVAHKGFIWIDVETTGRAAHGSQWHLGVDANAQMGRFLVLFEQEARALQKRIPHHLLGHASMHAAGLRGGSGRSTYAAHSLLEIERRTLPGETTQDVLESLQRIADRLHQEDPDFNATITLSLERPAFSAHADSQIVQALEAAAASVCRHAPVRTGENPWMDASLYANRGVDTVVFGAAGGGAHAAEEWVEVESVITLANCLADVAMRYDQSWSSHL